MRIGVLSDTHIPVRAAALPEAMLADFKNTDMVLHAGDIIEPGVLDSLKKVCKDVRAVFGNMDPYELKSKLSEKEIISAGNYRIGLTHGTGNPANLVDLLQRVFKDSGVDIVVFGHSHKPFNEKIGNILYFNPGSPTDDIFAPFKSYGIIELSEKIEAKIIKL